jgi:hypothetical protein
MEFTKDDLLKATDSDELLDAKVRRIARALDEENMALLSRGLKRLKRPLRAAPNKARKVQSTSPSQ